MSTRTSIKSSHWVQSSTKTSESDRRRRERMASTAVGYLINDEYELNETPVEPWEVRVHDVSRHGVGFVTSEQMKPGSMCRIRIGHGPLRLARRMRVVNCAAEGQNLYRIGAEFA
jgi:hypothetical protein